MKNEYEKVNIKWWGSDGNSEHSSYNYTDRGPSTWQLNPENIRV